MAVRLNPGDKIIVTIPLWFRTTNISAVVADAPDADPDMVRVVPKKRTLAPRWICVSAQFVRHDV